MGYTERQNIMAILVEGHLVEAFLTSQSVGEGETFIRVTHYRIQREHRPTCALKYASRRQGSA